MGDRAVIEIHQEGGTVCLYSHSDGLYLREVLAKALERGSGRWDDPQYLTRIIFNEMTKGREMETTGYGIHVGQAEELGPDNPTIYLDWIYHGKKFIITEGEFDFHNNMGYATNEFTPTEWIEQHNKEQACQ
jgi:hypothetical protein